MKKLVTLDEASKLTGVPYMSLRKYVLKPEVGDIIGVVRIGRRIYINRNSLMQFIHEIGDE